jgi:hypothetical protein
VRYRVCAAAEDLDYVRRSAGRGRGEELDVGAQGGAILDTVVLRKDLYGHQAACVDMTRAPHGAESTVAEARFEPVIAYQITGVKLSHSLSRPSFPADFLLYRAARKIGISAARRPFAAGEIHNGCYLHLSLKVIFNS